MSHLSRGCSVSDANVWVAASDGDLKRVKELIEVTTILLPRRVCRREILPRHPPPPDRTATWTQRRLTRMEDTLHCTPVPRTATVSCSRLDPSRLSNLFSCDRAAEVLQWLLEHGGDVTVRDHDGDTPLHACENPECAALLLENKADVEATNAEGQTPLDVAIEDERVEMLQWLQEQGIGDGVEALAAQEEEAGRAPFCS